MCSVENSKNVVFKHSNIYLVEIQEFIFIAFDFEVEKGVQWF